MVKESEVMVNYRFVQKIKYYNNRKSRKTRRGWQSIKNVRLQDLKKVFLGKRGGRREAGTPKLRWLTYIENDLTSMGVKRLRNKAEDRSSWAVILKEAVVAL